MNLQSLQRGKEPEMYYTIGLNPQPFQQYIQKLLAFHTFITREAQELTQPQLLAPHHCQDVSGFPPTKSFRTIDPHHHQPMERCPPSVQVKA